MQMERVGGLSFKLQWIKKSLDNGLSKENKLIGWNMKKKKKEKEYTMVRDDGWEEVEN